jgi:hypothetical protein
MAYSFSVFESLRNGSKLVGKTSPDFVPHEIFHKYSWLIPEGSNWYYWIDRKSTIQIPKSKSFYDTLDDPLKDSVFLLHEKGIPTTPSCSGHFNPDSFYEKVFDSLKGEEKEIRGSGIKLKDPESDSIYVYKDLKYRIPWTKESFLEISKDHGRRGVIGVFDEVGNIHRSLIKSPKENCEIVRNEGLTFFLTNPKDNKDLNSSWDHFHKCIKNSI